MADRSAGVLEVSTLWSAARRDTGGIAQYARRVKVMMAAVIALGAGCGGVPAGARGTTEVQASSDLFPTLLTARRAWTGETRGAKVRVWADDAFRFQNPQWQAVLDEQVAYANRVLIPMLGVGLVAEYRAWEHRAQSGELSAELDALVRMDPGDDVVWVVAFTGSTGEVLTGFDQLGTGHLAHLVVRGYGESEQLAVLERAYPAATADERSRALVARRRHQTTLALLHQLAHGLEAQHESEPDSIMSTTYAPAAKAAIGEPNRERMRRALEERLAVAGQYIDAERLLARAEANAAATSLAPVLRLFPARVRPRVLHCRIELVRTGAQDGAVTSACDEAAATGVDAAVAVAAARRAAGDIDGAQRTVIAAEARLASAHDRAPAAWLALAGEYREIGALTRAEDALARAGDLADHGIAASVATARARYGIPRGGARSGLEVDDEAAAATAVRNAIAQVNANQWDAAAKAIDAAEARWPALPGVLTARCALEYRRDAVAAARRLCERALAEGGSSWALFLLGTIELEAHRGAAPAAIAHLREAIARDPDLVQAWRTLGRALDRTRATAELEQLRRDYRARFNARLPD